MAPLTDVLIAKIVLGYLSSRNLSMTSDCFLKESKALNVNTTQHNKGRILNQLQKKALYQDVGVKVQDQNLLPSLEEILHDYFLYQETEDTASDKTYQLWKQLDVAVSQLRAITLGKKKAKAFIRSRTSTTSNLSQFLSKNDPDHKDAITKTLAATSSSPSPELFMPKVALEKEQVSTLTSRFGVTTAENLSTGPNDPATNERLTPHNTPNATPNKSSPFKNNTLGQLGITPRKEALKNELLKNFKSPKRKSLHPRRRSNPTENTTNTAKKVDFTPIVKAPASVEKHNISPLLINDEFNHIVETLMGNQTFTEKLADNINKVVSSDDKTKETEKEPTDVQVNVQKVYNLTSHDPELSDIWSLFGDITGLDEQTRQNICFPSKETLKDTEYLDTHSTVNMQLPISNTSTVSSELVTTQSSEMLTDCRLELTTESSVSSTRLSSNISNFSTATLSNTSTACTSTSPTTNHQSYLLQTNTISSIPHKTMPTFSDFLQDATNTSNNDSLPSMNTFLISGTAQSQNNINSPSNQNNNKLVVRNLQNEINICANEMQDNTEGSASRKISDSDDIPMATTHETSLNSTLPYPQQTPNVPTTLNVAAPLFQSQSSYLDIPSTFKSITMTTPKKTESTSYPTPIKHIDEESVSVADALLMLATSPGKPLSSNTDYPNLQPFSFMNELTQPLNEDITYTTGNLPHNQNITTADNTVNTVPRVNSTFEENRYPCNTFQNNLTTAPVSQLLVSDKNALLPDNKHYVSGNSVEHQQKPFFENPLKHLDVPQIFPKPLPIKIPVKTINVNSVKTDNRKKTGSLSDQLARKGHVIATKKSRKKNKKSEKKVEETQETLVVPRPLSFTSKAFSICSPSISTCSNINTSSTTISSNSQLLEKEKLQTDIISGHTSVWPDMMSSLYCREEDPPSLCSVKVQACRLNKSPAKSELTRCITIPGNNRIYSPVKSPLSSNSVQTVTIKGGNVSLSSPVKIKRILNSDSSNYSSSSHINIQQSKTFNTSTLSSTFQETTHPKTPVKNLAANHSNKKKSILKSPSSASKRHHRKDLKVKFDFKSPKKKEQHHFTIESPDLFVIKSPDVPININEEMENDESLQQLMLDQMNIGIELIGNEFNTDIQNDQTNCFSNISNNFSTTFDLETIAENVITSAEPKSNIIKSDSNSSNISSVTQASEISPGSILLNTNYSNTNNNNTITDQITPIITNHSELLKNQITPIIANHSELLNNVLEAPPVLTCTDVIDNLTTAATSTIITPFQPKPTASVKPFLFSDDSCSLTDVPLQESVNKSSKKRRRKNDKEDGSSKDRKEKRRKKNLEKLFQMSPDDYLSKVKPT